MYKYSTDGNSTISNILITSLINLTHLLQIFSLTVYFIVDAISHFQLCSSLTLSLSFCLSAVLLSPLHQLFDIKTLSYISTLSFIGLNKLIQTTSLFHLEVAHNTWPKMFERKFTKYLTIIFK